MRCKDCGHENGANRDEWCEHARAAYDEAFKRWEAKMADQIEATRRSQILTAEDYNIVINCRAD